MTGCPLKYFDAATSGARSSRSITSRSTGAKSTAGPVGVLDGAAVAVAESVGAGAEHEARAIAAIAAAAERARRDRAEGIPSG
ncbi:hypothetical protein GCM10009851_31180 [Herbiconiux moechotypicola]|uniref:Uncharacterized protein n=1 Tax=Herbiconiux moechotypicola TaxID=637393 RepID=A0ABN3DX60_9MICO